MILLFSLLVDFEKSCFLQASSHDDCSPQLHREKPPTRATHCRLDARDSIIYCDVCSESNHFHVASSRLKWFRDLDPTEEQPERCDICGGDFSRTPEGAGATLSTKLKCILCEKGYDRSERLLAHAYTHTGKKPFSCKKCFQSFTRNTTLRIHKRKSHSHKRSSSRSTSVDESSDQLEDEAV